MDLKELDLVDPSTHWYYQSKLVGIREILGNQLRSGMRIIDVGAGSGFFSIALAEDLTDMAVVCVDPHYEAETSRDGGSLRFVREIDEPVADLYLFIDVLEHVDDDLALLCSYTASAPVGATVVVSVPAFQSLWSSHDVFLEHRRRYRLNEVEQLVSDAGIKVTKARYLFSSIFPAAWLVRRLRTADSPRSDMKPAHTLINNLLTRLLSVEHRVFSNRLFGLSAVVVGVVDGDSD